MTVKFKVGFTISAETLFGIIAKFLPVEDLLVEEIEPRAERVTTALVARQPEKRAPRGPNRTPNLKVGANAAILAALADGQPHAYSDLKKALVGAGFSGTGVGAKLSRFRALGLAERIGNGLWRLTEARKKTA